MIGGASPARWMLCAICLFDGTGWMEGEEMPVTAASGSSGQEATTAQLLRYPTMILFRLSLPRPSVDGHRHRRTQRVDNGSPREGGDGWMDGRGGEQGAIPFVDRHLRSPSRYCI